MKKNLVIISLIMALCLCFSVGVCAEEPENPGKQQIIVNAKDNSIIFVSKAADASLLSAANEIPSFNDVSVDDWYNISVSHLMQLGAINGTTSTEFDPNKEVTRAEFSKMLAMAIKTDLSDYTGETAFTDVATDSWYAPSIQWANENKIILGKSSTTFAPGDYVTREEAATMVYRLAQSQNSRVIGQGDYKLTEEAKNTMTEEEIIEVTNSLEANTFKDMNSVSIWASEGIDVLNTAGLICGDYTGAFNPKNNILRAEAAKIISSYIIFNTTPTLYYDNSAPINYFEDKNENEKTDAGQFFNDLSLDDSVNVHGVSNFEDSTLLVNDVTNSGSTPRWGGTTHYGITHAAFNMVANSGRSYINNKMYEWISNISGQENGVNIAIHFSKDTDNIENNNKFEGHFYDGSIGESYTGSTTNNAFTNFNAHYYNALVGYNSNKFYAYKELGMAMHYIEDLNAPHHAKLVTSKDDKSNHHRYETWINSEFSSFGIPEMTYDSYRFMYDQDPKAIADNFSYWAKDSYGLCSNFDNNYNLARGATVINIHRTERGIAGLLNAYYYKAGLNG